ncbi:MAG: ketoacyl-ACP synthase III [Deltaproteobacteria bacterium]|nr:ketoacyl-ACP synthase III [Deltaproteobacteria bacterium]
MRVRIAGTGSYAPKTVVTNADLEKLVETNDAWIVERTGIRERRRADADEATSDMCTKAAKQALELAGWRADELDLIIVGTITPDYPFPSAAVLVQAKLGAKKAFAFDISAACAGSLFGLTVAEKFIRAGNVKKALVVGAELLTRITDWTDRNTCVLFGDGAGAMCVAPSTDESGLLSSHLYTDGDSAKILLQPGGGSANPVSQKVVDEKLATIHMEGKEVFKFAVRSLVDAMETALKENGLQSSDIKHVIAHQANLRIIEAVTKRLDIPMEKVWLNLEKYGNTSSASLPTTLDEANRAGRLKKGDLIGMMAIGAGMAWGSAVVRW